jgi:hypothetical protein
MALFPKLLPSLRTDGFKTGYNFRLWGYALGNGCNRYEVVIVGVASSQGQFSFHASTVSSASGGIESPQGLSCKGLRCREAT